MKKPLLLPLLLFSLPTFAGLSIEKRNQIEDLQKQLLTWAFRSADGGLATDNEGSQGDALERSGLLCLFGMQERCEDVKNAQGPDGRFWRAKQYIHVTTQDSFSRDHFNGVMAYYVATKDKDSAKRYWNYLKKNKFLLCDDASDNRCQMMPDTWGLMGLVWKNMGLKRDIRMTLAQKTVAPALWINARFSKHGFESVLPSWTGLILRKLDFTPGFVEQALKVAAKRQPLNPFVQFAYHGATEKVANQVLSMCPRTPGSGPYDFVWNRKVVEKNGQYFIESGSGTRLISDASDGWDCIMTTQFLLSEN